ncbi:MAG: Uma2 family endonuclease [Planctomycetes bacterium]|nr:Uma2 family endonuclease [Planctomycetota bacterium]
MIQPATLEATVLTAADLFERFGPIPLSRIGFEPLPGTATEEDVLNWHQSHKRLYELVDGVLVEKAMGFPESALACELSRLLGNWIKPRKLGVVVGADGMMRLAPGLIRIPDVSFMDWDRFPNRQVGTDPIPGLVPDLAVEVLSPSNTEREMERKLQDYFGVGVKLVWYIEPRRRTVDVYTAPDQTTRLTAGQTLHGGAVLPGFQLPLAELFADLDPH